jgi:hypothetical protein
LACLGRNGVRDASTVVESVSADDDDDDPRSATLRRYLLRLVLGSNAATRAMRRGPQAPAPFRVSGHSTSTAADAATAASTALREGGSPAESAGGVGRSGVVRCAASAGCGVERAPDGTERPCAPLLENQPPPPPPPLRRQDSVGARLRDAVAGIGPGPGSSLGLDAVAAARRCLDQLAAIAARVRRDPGDGAARRLRHANPALAQDVLCYPQAEAALRLLGFADEDEEAEWLVLRTVDLDLLTRFEGIVDEVRRGLEAI